MNSPTMVLCWKCKQEVRIIDAHPLWNNLPLNYICNACSPPLNDRQKRMMELEKNQP